MSNLNTKQFGAQMALFPPDHPVMRERGPAEFTPQEFNEKPGALFHGTYQDKMPREGLRDNSAGIHLGTLESAKQRIDNLGPRRAASGHAADIHVRRLNPGVGTKHAQMPMEGTPENPKHDRGADWTVVEQGMGRWQEDRGADKFGEYYRNDSEDPGSVSVRVPDHGYLSSHEDAVNRAVASGKPVSALTKGLLEHHGGQGVDEPIKHHANYASWRGNQEKDPWSKEQVNHESLLPYKISGNPAHPERPSERRAGFRGLAITFTATKEEAEAKTAPPTGPEKVLGSRWKKNYLEPYKPPGAKK